MSKRTGALLLIALALAIGGVYALWRHQRLYPSTTDAYLGAHVVRIEPRVGGQVVKLPVHDHQHVIEGALLLAIDDRPYRIAVQQAQAELALAQQRQLTADAAMAAAAAAIEQQQAQLDNAQRNFQRDQRLLASQAVSRARVDSDRDRLHEMQAAVAAQRAARLQADRRRGEAAARIGVAQAALAKAQLELSYTTVTAPASGTLGEISVRPGDVVQGGQALFPLVEERDFWVEANYKETDLARIRRGQPANVALDMYPDTNFRGVVDSLSPASGVAFSLLPPENATGNWVKVTQRFPVRVRVLREDGAPPLRIGASCSVTIDTTGGGNERSAGSSPQGR